jgi:hypothetical protein
MASTYEPIATTTLGTAAATLTLSTIPGSYTDLVLVASVKASTSGQGLTMQFNGDGGAGSLYSTTGLRGNGTAASSFRQSNTNNVLLSNFAEPPTGSPNVCIAQFSNYSNTTTYKTVLVRANSAGFGVDALVGLWRNTNAITSIKIDISGGNMSIGSTFTLYGIKAF